MSMKHSYEVEPIPQETQTLAWRMSPKGTLVMHLRDGLGPIYQNEDFAWLFPNWGRPAHAPWRLALISVLQVVEDLSDRQAVQMLQVRIDWRYALSLSVDAKSFDFSVLSDFRQRLLAHNAADLLLEPILQVCRERGWLKAGGKQRTDSTFVLAHIRSLNSLEAVGESMRATLNSIAEMEPDWLLSHLNPEWFDRYVHRFELVRFPKEESKRAKLREQVGQDVQALLHLLEEGFVPPTLAGLAQTALLRRVFEQHYRVEQGQAHWRDGPAVTNEERVISPYDPQARQSRKRETKWDGYKVHLTETCDQDPSCPHLVVHVETTQATIQDNERLGMIQQHLRARGLSPQQQYVDGGYTSGLEVAKEAEQGTEIVGPVPADGGWQHRAQTGYAVSDFQLDWQEQIAICPQGQQSLKWSPRLDARKRPGLLIRFPLKGCRSCPVREQCTKGSQQGRTLNLTEQAAHQALVQRRAEQFTPAYQQRYALRAGIEGTLSQGIRALDLRRTPYLGTEKTHLHHLAVAAGMNLIRLEAHMQAQACNRPTRPPRPLTPFARVQQQWKARGA